MFVINFASLCTTVRSLHLLAAEGERVVQRERERETVDWRAQCLVTPTVVQDRLHSHLLMLNRCLFYRRLTKISFARWPVFVVVVDELTD